MKYWEFLIQKEGDDTWLPLETQQVEILEGRYRVVAHTDRLNTPMEIQVSQLDTSQMPPRRRDRKRVSQTNEAGLVVVMPYLHLKPGQWDLRCSGTDQTSADHATSNQIGNPSNSFVENTTWQYQVQLQVFAPTDEDWSSEWPVPEDAPSAHSRLIESDESESQKLSDDSPLIQAKAQLQNNLRRQGQMPTEEAATLEGAYQISLRQQAFLAMRNQSMTIMGQVQALSDEIPIQGASQLWLRLQNPETATVIMEAHRPLSLERLPADFKVKIQLPANVQTRVVLGEVLLRTAPVNNEPSKLLTSTGFTITAGIDQLVEEIANRDPGTFEEEVAALSGQSVVDQGAVPVEHNGQAEPHLISPILDPTRQTVMPAVGVVLPPQLEHTLEQASLESVLEASEASLTDHRHRIDASGDRTTDQPELPTFPKTHQNPSPLIVSDSPVQQPLPQQPSEDLHTSHLSHRQSLVSQPAQFMGTSIEDDDLEADQIAALLEDIDEDLASQPANVDSLEPPGVAGMLEVAPNPMTLPGSNRKHATRWESGNSSEDAQEGSNQRSQTERSQQSLQKPTDEKAQQQTAVNHAFKSLKIQENFWQRLSNLTHEGREEAAQLAEDMQAAGVSPKADGRLDKPIPNSRSGARSLPPFPVDKQNGLPANSEVVVYDQQPIETSQQKVLEVAPETNKNQLAPPSYPQASSEGLTSTSALPAKPSTLSSYTPPPTDAAASTKYTQAQPAQAQIQVSRHLQPQTSRDELPEMELPVISVPAGDFVAGEIVTVTVRTRPSVYKPFIKLWMVDRQSRTLVGDPKLLTNLKPDALGYLEASAELQVPMSCLDVQIAAIAVDMATQQESNKAVVNRHVVPADQSKPPLRRFNL